MNATSGAAAFAASLEQSDVAKVLRGIGHVRHAWLDNLDTFKAATAQIRQIADAVPLSALALRDLHARHIEDMARVRKMLEPVGEIHAALKASSQARRIFEDALKPNDHLKRMADDFAVSTRPKSQPS